jgi:hypothetical protein
MGSSIRDVRAVGGGGHDAKVDKCRNAMNLVNLSTEQQCIGGGSKSEIFYGCLLRMAPMRIADDGITK